MKKKNLMLLVLLLVIGFASVSTTLVINGIVGIGANESDFNIIFTSARLNDRNRNDFIEPTEKKTLTFTTDKLINLNETAVLDYEVTNTSRLYDADVDVTCNIVDEEENVIESNDYISIEYEPTNMTVLAGQVGTGKITAKLKKASTEDGSIKVKCTLSANATEKDVLGEEYVEPFTKAGTLKATTASNTSDFWGYKENITKVVFENKITEKENAAYTFDVSIDPEKPVKSYLVPDEEYPNFYILYIASNSGVYANEDSSNLFSGFSNLMYIEGMRYFNTSNVTNMSNMFFNCQYLMDLDLSYFDTSKVTNMSGMFYSCGHLETLDLSTFDTSQVTDMSSMFFSLVNLNKLEVSSFDTSKVTNMMMMFASNSKLLELDLSNFNTSNVTNMMMMFTGNHSLLKLNVSNFDTSKVTGMNGMFMACLKLEELDLSSFDTRSVTGMGQMFQNCKSLKLLDIRKFDFSNSLQSVDCIFNIMPDDAKVIVKDANVQSTILNMESGDTLKRPTAWTTENVVVAA